MRSKTQCKPFSHVQRILSIRMIIIFIQLSKCGVEIDYASLETGAELGHKACLGDIGAAEIALPWGWFPGQSEFPERFQVVTLSQVPLPCSLVLGSTQPDPPKGAT